MHRSSLLFIGGLIVSAVLIGLALQSRSLAQQVKELESLRIQDRTRLEATQAMLERAVNQIEHLDPVEAASLRVQTKIVQRGDLQWLEPSPETNYLFRFDELL